MKVKINKYPKRGNRRKIKVQIDPWDTYSLDRKEHTSELQSH